MIKRLLVLALLVVCQPLARAQQDPGWPRQIDKNGATLIYYQPQLDEWNDYKTLAARVAFSLAPAGQQPVLAVLTFHAQTETDTQKRTVVIYNAKIGDVRFQSADPNASPQLETLLRSIFPTNSITVSLDRMLAYVDRKKKPAQPVAVNTEPPTIFVSSEKSILLLTDGEPIRAPVKDSKLEIVPNANWTLFYGKSEKQYYLLAEKLWLTAADVKGPWTIAKKLPKDMEKLPKQEEWKDLASLIPPPASTGPAPKVFYSDKPAELIAFKGSPVYTRIPGTTLLYVNNTDSQLFQNTTDNQFYYLVSGRWYSAKSLAGPWTYATANLPKDFAKIPRDSPKANVMASVPGTQEAADAVLLAQIPQTATINIKEAEKAVKVDYDGKPEFKPIENTSLSYATNTAEKVIKLGDTYYLCYQALWFTSSSPEGPWTVAESIPKEIYQIPVTSPVHNVTYVTQNVTSEDTVESSTTAGYVGMFVVGAAVGATICYGSGYYYPPYVHYGYGYPVYRPYPATYGWGATYNPATGVYRRGGYAYGPYGGAGGSAFYNPRTGTYGRSASAYGPYGAARGARAYNPYTGGYAATRQGANAYSQWGSSVVSRGGRSAATQHVTTSRGTAARYATSSGQSGVVARGHNNNVYAGGDGNVYRRESSGSWQKYDNGNWDKVDTSAARSQAQERAQSARDSGQLQSLDRDASARQQGNVQTQRSQQRSSSYQRSSPSRSGGGGGRRGGGRR